MCDKMPALICITLSKPTLYPLPFPYPIFLPSLTITQAKLFHFRNCSCIVLVGVCMLKLVCLPSATVTFSEMFWVVLWSSVFVQFCNVFLQFTTYYLKKFSFSSSNFFCKPFIYLKQGLFPLFTLNSLMYPRLAEDDKLLTTLLVSLPVPS